MGHSQGWSTRFSIGNNLPWDGRGSHDASCTHLTAVIYTRFALAIKFLSQGWVFGAMVKLLLLGSLHLLPGCLGACPGYSTSSPTSDNANPGQQ